jgi:hypothetical protein
MTINEFGLVNEFITDSLFIKELNSLKDSSIPNSHTPQFTAALSKSFSDCCLHLAAE